MAVWGNNSASSTNLSVKDSTYWAGGPASLSGQQLDSVWIRTGTVTGTHELRVALYGNSVEDIESATLIEDLGSRTDLTSFTSEEFSSVTNPATLGDYAYLFIAVKSDDTPTTLQVRGNLSAAAGDISEAYFLFDSGTDGGVAFPSTAPDAGTDYDPGSLYAWIDYSAAPAGGGELLTAPQGMDGGFNPMNGGFSV